MAVFHVFLLVLVIGIVHHSHGRTYESESITINGTDTLPVKAPSNTPTNYDYFSLVLQWPKSFCNTGGVTCISPIPNSFTVHGLWPQLHNGRITCNSDMKLNYAELTALKCKNKHCLFYMNKHWPNLNSRGHNYGFWDHEYQKHGSCFWPFQTDPFLYFIRTVEMKMQHIRSVTKMLLHSGIQPGGKYYLCEFEKAISDHLKFIPRLRYNKAGGSGIFQLYEIAICFNTKFALINCGRNLNCGNSQDNPLVMFPQP